MTPVFEWQRDIEAISSGAQAPHNEDWAGTFRTPAALDLVLIDGATSVAERDYIDPVHGDIDAGLDQQAAVHAAADTVYGAFRERSAGQDVPLHAWPIAPLSWVRARKLNDAYQLAGFCLGDCKLLMRRPDGEVQDLDPFINPQEAILRAEIGKHQAQGNRDPATRKARLMPMLPSRREFQNTAPHTNSLCLKPNGAFGARRFTVEAQAGAVVLGMTDGFYRLEDTCGLHTPDNLFTLCLEQGLSTALSQLRQHEAAAQAQASISVKRADDASAILWRTPLQPY